MRRLSRMAPLLAALGVVLAGCMTMPERSGHCGSATGGMYRPVVSLSLNGMAKANEPTGLVFGSVGSLGDFDQRAISWILWLTRDPDGPNKQRVMAITHVLGATTDDFKLFTPRQGRRPPGAAVFCAALEPGVYAVEGLRVSSIAYPLPTALKGANANGVVEIGHRFAVSRDSATYIGQYVVGSGGVEAASVADVFATNEVKRDSEKAVELGVKLDSFPIQVNVPTQSTSATAIRRELPAPSR
jgi:hypothetical protein